MSQGQGVAVFVDNGGVRLHAIDNRCPDASRPPVVVVPGMAEHAEEYRWMLDSLGSRRVVVVDVRGRGRSDVPESGYTWEHHVDDLRAVVGELGLERPVCISFSRGTAYALGYALAEPGEVRGLVVGDYFARQPGIPAGLADRHLATRVRGELVADRMSEHAVRRVFAESIEVPLWGRLVELTCPVLLVRGGRASALVTEDVAARWRAALPSVQIAVLPNAGHDLWSRDRDAYLAVVVPFLAAIDATGFEVAT